MKKLILIIGILTAGIVSANTNSLTNEESSNIKTEKKIVVKSSEKDSKIVEKYSKVLYPIYYTTSCGVSAVTNQTTWTEEQIMAWAAALEENYC